jgi:hypothetical protein
MPKKLLRAGTKMKGGGPEKQVKKASASDKSGGKQAFDGRSFLGGPPTVRGGIPGRESGQCVYWGDAK